VEVVEYATQVEIVDEPSSRWPAPYVLRKLQQVVSALKQKSVKRTHKFGIRVSHIVKKKSMQYTGRIIMIIGVMLSERKCHMLDQHFNFWRKVKLCQ